MIPPAPKVPTVLGGSNVAYNATATSDVASHYTGTGGTAAVATITFTGHAVEGEEITIVSTDGTSKTYTAGASSAPGINQFIAGDAAAAATSLKACLEHSQGHPSLITVVDDTAGELTLTQVTKGDLGNRTITSELTNVTVVTFAGGSGADYDEGDEAVEALVAGYATDEAHAKKLEHARKVVLGYI